jgi:hypothetical protein
VELAKALRQTVGWNHCVPLQFPIAPGVTRQYVTCLNDTGSVATSRRLHYIIAGAKPEINGVPQGGGEWGGGKVLNPSINADGTVAILQDCEGAPFCLLHHTDEWDGVKPTTVIAQHLAVLGGETHEENCFKKAFLIPSVKCYVSFSV